MSDEDEKSTTNGSENAPKKEEGLINDALKRTVEELTSLYDVGDLIEDSAPPDALDESAEEVEAILAKPHATLEEALTAQALTLDRVFHRLAKSSAGASVKRVDATEMSLALQTQLNFRRTLETLQKMEKAKV